MQSLQEEHLPFGAQCLLRFCFITSFGRIKIRLDNALALSAIVFILYQPFVLFQPGFQLSYIAAFSLVFSSKILAKTKSLIGTSFLVTSISQFSLYPILLFHFYELSLSSFFVNVFYVPLYSVIILPANIILLIVTCDFFLQLLNILVCFLCTFREFIRILQVGFRHYLISYGHRESQVLLKLFLL